jgi:peptide/nickel transport system ATP-binding protein
MPILTNVNFDVPQRKVLGITGASGSGKSMTALSIMGLVGFYENVQIHGQVNYLGRNLLDNSPTEWQKMRGKVMSLIIQQPEAALNPVKKIGNQLSEALTNHIKGISKTEIRQLVNVLLHDVGLTETERIFKSYPHELSGGQLQRVVIAMAIAHQPEIIIADEATSSLDAETSKEIVQLLINLQQKRQSTLIFITHDMVLLREISDYILLLKDGRVADYFSKEDLTTQKLALETAEYMNAGKFASRSNWVSNETESALNIQSLSKTFYKPTWLFWKKGQAEVVLKDITLSVTKGKMLGILGVSGSGKTTLAKIIAGILPATEGEILFKGQKISQTLLADSSLIRRQIQIVMQDALTSMNPKIKIGDQWREVIKYYALAKSEIEINALVHKILLEFSLPPSVLDKYPIQLSGGQRQRAALARTLLVEPELVIFDESLSALDVFNQQKMISLIIALQESRQFTGIFIAHDRALVNALCHEIIVIDQGEIVQ